MNFRKFRKLRRDARAISPIISTLLLIAIAVVAALVTYAWVMGYIGFQTSKAGNAIQIQSITFSGTPGTSGAVSEVYVQNVGSSAISIVPTQCLYVNGVLDTKATSTLTTIPAQSTAMITPGAPTTYPSGTVLTIKVTTGDGTYNQITQSVP